MSATGRGTEREDKDFYPTPPRPIRRLLDVGPELPGGQWLEAGAGSGAIIRTVDQARTDVHWTGVEIRPDAERFLRRIETVHPPRILITDFLREPAEQILPPGVAAFDVGLGNPPFMHAAEFIDRGLDLCLQVVLLLRLNFLGSSTDRRDLFERRGMPDVFPLPERDSFTGGGTDSCEYAWYRWTRVPQKEGRMRILYPRAQLGLPLQTSVKAA